MCDGQESATAAQKLVNIDKVRYIVGASCSGATLAYLPITEEAKVLVFPSGASNVQVTNGTDYVFRLMSHDGFLGARLAEIAKSKYDKVAIISESTEYAQGLRDVFVNKFSELGGKVVVDESYLPEDTDYRSSIAKVKQSNAEGLFVNSQAGSGASRITKQAREQELTQQFFAAYWTGPDFVEAGPWVNGTIVVDAPALREERKKSADFLIAHQARYAKGPNYPFMAAATYESVYLLARAIEEVGEDPDDIAEYLHSLANIEGAHGDFHFDEHGESVGLVLSQFKIVKNKLVLLDN